MKGGGRTLYAYTRAVLFATFYRTPTENRAQRQKADAFTKRQRLKELAE